MQREDWFERLVQKIAAFVARVCAHAGAGDVAAADEALREAWDALGLRHDDVLRLDDATLRALLGERTVLGASLLDAEAAVHEARGADARAEATRRRARALRG